MLRRLTGVLAARGPCAAAARQWRGRHLDAAIERRASQSVAINSIWVMVAALLVIFMQAGFAFLEIGFSRGKNAGTVVAKILTNFSIAALVVLGGRLRLRLRRRATIIGTQGFFLRDYGDPQEAFAVDGPLRRHDRDEVALPVLVLRRLAGDRVGHDARADQVRRLRDLRGRLRRPDLPDRLALGLRRRLAADQPRHAGLRRLDGRPPDRRDRRARGPAAARPAPRQVRLRREAAGDPGAQHAAVRPRRPDPVARLVRLQRGLDAGRARRALPGGRAGDAAGRRRRRARRLA